MKSVLKGASLAVVLGVGLSTIACSMSIPSVVGAWGDSKSAGTPSLTFKSDGTYSGTDGCNQLGGNWNVDEEAVDQQLIDLDQMRSTKMFCEGVDTWLSQAASAELVDNNLGFSDSEGNTLGSLQRTVE